LDLFGFLDLDLFKVG